MSQIIIEKIKESAMLHGHRLSDEQVIELIGIAQAGLIDEGIERITIEREAAISLMDENRLPVHVVQISVSSFGEAIKALEAMK